jgi:hypothetical protein
MPLTQRQQLLRAVIELCEKQGARTFALDEFQESLTPRLERKGNWTTKTPEATVRLLTTSIATLRRLIIVLTMF